MDVEQGTTASNDTNNITRCTRGSRTPHTTAATRHAKKRQTSGLPVTLSAGWLMGTAALHKRYRPRTSPTQIPTEAQYKLPYKSQTSDMQELNTTPIGPPEGVEGSTRDVLERGEGGSEGGRGRGVWLGHPSSQGPPMVPAEGENLEASILLAPKAPKQHFGCQPQTLEGQGRGVQGGGGGGYPPPPPTVYGRSKTSLGGGAPTWLGLVGILVAVGRRVGAHFPLLDLPVAEPLQDLRVVADLQ